MTNIHTSKDIHKKEDTKQPKGEFKMKIFTDASITFNKNEEPIFATHAIIVFDEKFKLQKKTSFVTNEININKAEANTILVAIENAKEGSVIYTDSKHNATFNKKLKKLAKEKNIEIQWIKRKANAMADLLCSQKRNEMLQYLVENDNSLIDNLPKERNLSKFDREFIKRSIEKFSVETNQTIEIPSYTFTSDFNKYNKAVKKRKGIYSKLKEIAYNENEVYENLANVVTELELKNMYDNYYKKNVKKEFRIDYQTFVTSLGDLNYCVMNTKNNRKIIVDFVILKKHIKEHLSISDFSTVIAK